MKKLLIAITICANVQCFAQHIISAQGGSYSSQNAIIDFSVGEVVIATLTDGQNDLTQGFHQTTWNISTSQDENERGIQLSIYPNPTDEFLNIYTAEFSNAEFVMHDLYGRVIMKGLLNDATTTIRVGHLAAGQYSLSIRQGNSELKTINLIKIP